MTVWGNILNTAATAVKDWHFIREKGTALTLQLLLKVVTEMFNGVGGLLLLLIILL